MVAKMPRSTSFLITKLAFTSSFSESSLTVMPSEMVISRLMGGGAAASRRDLGPQYFFFGLALTVAGAAALKLWAAGSLVGRRRRRTRSEQSATARGGMHRPRTAGTLSGQNRAIDARLHGRRAWTRRSLIERLARARCLRTQRHAGTDRRRRLAGHGRTHLLLAQLGDKIGTRRNDGPGDGLAGIGPGRLGRTGGPGLAGNSAGTWRQARSAHRDARSEKCAGAAADGAKLAGIGWRGPDKTWPGRTP